MGLTGQIDMWRNRMPFRRNFPELADAQFASGGAPPCILVYVDCWTSLGGSQYLDSPGTGKYHTYLCDEVVPWVDGNDLRRLVLDDTAVGVFDVNLAAREKSHVGVHAELGADDRLHVHRPAKAGGIDHPLDARCSSAPDLESHVTDVAKFSASDSGQQRIESALRGLLARQRPPFRRLRS